VSESSSASTGLVTCDLSVSADGYVAGPNQSVENPLGEGGMALHEWHFAPEGVDATIVEEWQGGVGAYIMGRNMFGPDRGEWDLEWTGWWGEEPPYGVPVFVLGHRPRPSVQVGRTTFLFVTDGIETALAEARVAAGEQKVAIAGGASTANQYLAAGLIDQLHLHIAPVVLGRAGERIFHGVPPITLTPLQVLSTPKATHVKYAVSRD
jgi:dihydrofolate reductase